MEPAWLNVSCASTKWYESALEVRIKNGDDVAAAGERRKTRRTSHRKSTLQSIRRSIRNVLRTFRGTVVPASCERSFKARHFFPTQDSERGRTWIKTIAPHYSLDAIMAPVNERPSNTSSVNSSLKRNLRYNLKKQCMFSRPSAQASVLTVLGKFYSSPEMFHTTSCCTMAPDIAACLLIYMGESAAFHVPRTSGCFRPRGMLLSSTRSTARINY